MYSLWLAKTCQQPISQTTVKVSLRWKSPACIKERLSTGAHQSPTENEKEKQQRLIRAGGLSAMRSGLRLALLKPAALPVARLPDTPLPLFLLLKCILCLVFVILFKIFIAWQCSLVASWCTLCVGMPKFSRGVAPDF